MATSVICVPCKWVIVQNLLLSLMLRNWPFIRAGMTALRMYGETHPVIGS